MKFIHLSYEDFLKKASRRNIVQFGVLSRWDYYEKVFPNIVEDIVMPSLFIVDNDPLKQGKNVEMKGRTLNVKPVEELRDMKNFIIVIMVSLFYQKEICRQLVEMELPDDVECYSLPLMVFNMQNTDNSVVDEYFQTHLQRVNVPKIHSFWFSGEEKPEIYRKCIESWKVYCPEFEIIEWNADNYDISKNQYMLEAFKHRKWAFVSDYARLDVIFNYGGIYLDMDVELKASMEPLLKADCFFFRQHDGFLELGSGFGAPAGNFLVKEMLDSYNGRRFVNDDGTLNMTPQPELISKILTEHGINKSHNSMVVGDILIMSNDYIVCTTEKEEMLSAKLGIHWHNAGWMEDEKRDVLKGSFLVKKELLEQYFKNEQRVGDA